MHKKKVLFYIANYFVFRSGPIGYLYDVCQEFPTVFLSEKLDPETEKTLGDKNFFPKMEKIIPISQFTGERMNLFQKNFYLYKTAKEILEKEKPDIVICSSDTHSLFEMYLMRLSKKKNVIRITVQTGNVGDNAVIERRVDLTNAYLRFPEFIPLFIRLQMVKLRKYIGHFIYYWILPVLNLEMPFFGRASYILYKGNSGMRDSSFQTVFSKKDYDIFLKDGVPIEKLYIVSHPFLGKSRKFFEAAFWKKFKKEDESRKAITVLLPEDKIGFKREANSLIPEKEVFNARRKILDLIINILDDWTIYLKPHPDIIDVQKFLSPFAGANKNIRIADKADPLDKYIEISDVILELPLAAGTALFSASLQCPEKPVISLDPHQEILGDYYKETSGIEYIDNLDKLAILLRQIKSSEYQKDIKNKIENETENIFSDIAEFLHFLLSEKAKT